MSTTDSVPAITVKTRLDDVLETEACGRCGGTGHYSYNQVDGTRCYGCGGSGRRYTKRGRAAREYWQWLQQTTVETVQVGDRLFDNMHGWVTVTGVVAHEAKRGNAHGVWPAKNPEAVERYEADPHYVIEPSDEEGMVWARYVGPSFDVRTSKIRLCGLHPGHTLMVIDPAVRVPALKAVATYQAGLTKAGKPRKR